MLVIFSSNFSHCVQPEREKIKVDLEHSHINIKSKFFTHTHLTTKKVFEHLADMILSLDHLQIIIFSLKCMVQNIRYLLK